MPALQDRARETDNVHYTQLTQKNLVHRHFKTTRIKPLASFLQARPAVSGPHIPSCFSVTGFELQVLTDRGVSESGISTLRCGPQGNIVFELDIEALYSLILLDKGLEVMSKVLQSRSVEKEKHNIFIADLLRFLLKHNKFHLDQQFFCKVQGTAMGTKCALANANVSLGDLKSHPLGRWGLIE